MIKDRESKMAITSEQAKQSVLLASDNIIKCSRLILKPLDKDNGKKVANIFTIPEINRFAEAFHGKTAKEMYTVMKESGFLAPQKPNYYAAIYTKSNEVIGFFSLEHDDEDNFFYMDIYIDPKHQRQRYATETITEGLAQYLDQNPEIKKIAAYIASSNTKSNSMYHSLINLAHERDIEFKKMQYGITSALWTSSFIRKLAYGCVAATAAGLLLYWNFRNTAAAVPCEDSKGPSFNFNT